MLDLPWQVGKSQGRGMLKQSDHFYIEDDPLRGQIISHKHKECSVERAPTSQKVGESPLWARANTGEAMKELGLQIAVGMMGS